VPIWDDYRIAPNFRGIIFSWISWLTRRSRIFYSRKFNFLGRGLFTNRSVWCIDQVLIIKMTAGFKKSNPSKAMLPSPTGPLSLRMPSFCIELARRPTKLCVAEELERTSDSTSESATKSTKRIYSCYVIIMVCALSSSLYSSNALEYVPLITHCQSSWHKSFPLRWNT